MIKIEIDGKKYEVRPGKNLLETCLELGFDLPYFCYHPAMGSVGACRQCAVKRYRSHDDLKGRIIMSCMEPVADGMIISVNDPEAKAFREAVVEGLMTNHPHDCPVCDEGGECHLQDMTVMTGHNYRRYDFKKRTHNNQYLGPFLAHEMNRCIQCYRCVRFYKDYAGGKDLAAFSSRNHVYFGRHEEGVLESEFSGNLAEVCPTGVFTDKTLRRHFTRKWDISNSPSICVHCSAGCNTIAGERYGILRRIMNRYNGAVNGYFLCDRGRFGYEFVNGDKTIKEAWVRASKNDQPVAVSQSELSAALTEALKEPDNIIGIGSPRASLEANFALSQLVGEGNFYHGLSGKDLNLVKTALHILQNAPVHSPSMKEMEKADAVLILGEDVTNTAPMVALAVRQAIRNKGRELAGKAGIPSWHSKAQLDLAQDMKSPVFIATSYNSRLDDIAEQCFRGSQNDIARLGFAIANSIEKEAPLPVKLSKEMKETAQTIADVLKSANNPLIITGTHCGSEEVLQAAANIGKALSAEGKNVSLSMIVPECNSLGTGMMNGGSLDEVLVKARKGEAGTVIILENDIYRRLDKNIADEIIQKSDHVIVLDHIMTETAQHAGILCPVGNFAGSEGTMVSQEGRAQRYYTVFPHQDTIPSSWRLLGEMIGLAGKTPETAWAVFDDVVTAMSAAIPAFKDIRADLPDAGPNIFNEKIRRQTIRYSGRTAMNANKAVSEGRLPKDADSPLAFSMEGANEQPPSSMVPFYWAPGWNSVQAANYYMDEPGGSLKGGDPGLRLIEKQENGKFDYYAAGLLPLEQKEGELMFVPVHQIFGSEELSSEAPAVKERIPLPFVLLNTADALANKAEDKKMIKIEIGWQVIEARVRIEDGIPRGIAGLSTGLPGMPHVSLPLAGQIKK
jgi:NADH-quinone oxidoreductase subunit G